MGKWVPTMELRYVKRNEVVGSYVRILQQKWYLSEYFEGEGFLRTKDEWRNVPEVSDEKTNDNV